MVIGLGPAGTRELSRELRTMNESPRHKNPSKSSLSRATTARGYVGRHRKTRTKLVGACVQVLLTGVLVFGTVGQIYRHAEQQTTTVRRDV